MKKLSKIVAIGVALFSSLFLTCCGSNKDKSTLIVGLECNYAPFNWTETSANENTLPIEGKANQYADGYDIQIAKLIGEYENMNVVIRKMDWDSLIPSLQNGEINAVIAGMTDTEGRRKSIDFTDEYYRSEVALIVKKENDPGKILDDESFRDYINGKSIVSQISTITNDLIDEVFVKNYGAIQNKPLDTFATAALDVLKSQSFAMTAELPVAKSIVASNPGLSVVRISQEILGEEGAKLGVSIGITKGNDELKEKINDALNKISKETRESLMDDAITRNKLSENTDGSIDNEVSMNTFSKIGYLIKNYWGTFLTGLISTLILAVLGTIVGLFIGTFIALGKNVHISKDDNYVVKVLKHILRGICKIYSIVLRGTPMMVQALIFKFGCAALGLNWNAVLTGVPVFDGWLICGLIVIILNTGAYMGEDIQAGLNGLDSGQNEAARSLGMSKFKSFTLVILPQALRNCLPTLANEYIINVKDSSVLNVISVTELFLSVSIATSKNYFMVEGYIIIAAIYLILTLIATGIFKLITNKLDGKKYKIKFFRKPLKGVTNN